MKTILKLFIGLFFVVVFFNISMLNAQEKSIDSLQRLDEVVLHVDRLLQQFTETQNKEVLSDSIIAKSTSLLTQLLQSNSSIYFRENGLGMVSSASFRGTNAQQTAVIWNGLNINSQLNGQTDFNTINTRNFNTITIRHGGGSVLYGSGAIGGSIHLNDKIAFNSAFKNQLFASAGSFDTQDLSFKSSYGNDKFGIGFSLAYTRSDNDYSYEFNGRERTNLNGQLYNIAFSGHLGYKINAKHTLRYYSYIYDDERHLSLIIPTEIPTKYQNFNVRQLLEWEGRYGKWFSILRGAYLLEKYKYFGNIESDAFSFGEASSFIGNYQLKYNWSQAFKLVGLADVNYTLGEGSSIGENSRTISAFSLLATHRIDKFYYEAALRKEITNTYKSPLLFSLGMQYKFSNTYTLNTNVSKNFRIPTYNDLYWEGSGNLNLSPETSYQYELGSTFAYNNLKLNVTGFYSDIKDMIRWVPSSNGPWQPINTGHVVTYGGESQLAYDHSFDRHKFGLNMNYAYTISKNQDTDKQLMYVPYHKGSGTLIHTYKNVNTYWQTTYAGEVFTQSDNNPNRVVEAYWVHNFGLEYKGLKALTLGCRIQNLLNKNYQSVANRYMPGIHTNFYLNYNFKTHETIF
ncbi:MAG: TonB-dependent receptor [Flavobacteriaceae bacterium]|nr:TonB-dependent receptor [Flavobacteriaceae bacterium]